MDLIDLTEDDDPVVKKDTKASLESLEGTDKLEQDIQEENAPIDLTLDDIGALKEPSAKRMKWSPKALSGQPISSQGMTEVPMNRLALSSSSRQSTSPRPQQPLQQWSQDTIDLTDDSKPIPGPDGSYTNANRQQYAPITPMSRMVCYGLAETVLTHVHLSNISKGFESAAERLPVKFLIHPSAVPSVYCEFLWLLLIVPLRMSIKNDFGFNGVNDSNSSF
jgi:hypothetical protein